MTYQVDDWLLANVVLASTGLGFIVCPAPLALVETLLGDFQPIAHVELAAVLINERDCSDWLLVLANHCMRKETEVTKRATTYSGGRTQKALFIFYLLLI